MSSQIESAIDVCLEAAATPERWSEALGVMATAMGSCAALLSRPQRNHYGVIYSPDMDHVRDLWFDNGWNLRDLRSARAMQRGPNAITADQHVISADDLDKSEYYNDFARRAGVPWFASFGMIAPGQVFVGMSFQRSAAEGAFSNSELEILSRTIPRLRQAMSLSASMANSRNVGRIDGLALLDQAAVLLADNGDVLAANPMAEAILANGSGLRRSIRGLAAAHPASRHALERYLAAVCGSGPDAELVAAAPFAVACTDGRVLFLQATPLVGDAYSVFGSGRAVVMITQVGDSRAPSAERLRIAFDLTATEARVAAFMATGMPVRQIAEALHMNEAAVRFHVKSILPKAQQRTSAQFVAAAARLG